MNRNRCGIEPSVVLWGVSWECRSPRDRLASLWLVPPGAADRRRAVWIDLVMSKNERERSLAMFVDLENLAMGFQNSAQDSSSRSRKCSNGSSRKAS